MNGFVLEPLPQPVSADDVNPDCLVPVRTQWLLPSTSAMETSRTQPASTADKERALASAGFSAAVPAQPQQTLDLADLSHDQLVTAVQRHNSTRNIFPRPTTAMLANVLSALEPLPEEYHANPKTLGGQPGETPWTRGWRKVARQKGAGGGTDASRGGRKGGGGRGVRMDPRLARMK